MPEHFCKFPTISKDAKSAKLRVWPRLPPLASLRFEPPLILSQNGAFFLLSAGRRRRRRCRWSTVPRIEIGVAVLDRRARHDHRRRGLHRSQEAPSLHWKGRLDSRNDIPRARRAPCHRDGPRAAAQRSRDAAVRPPRRLCRSRQMKGTPEREAIPSHASIGYRGISPLR